MFVEEFINRGWADERVNHYKLIEGLIPSNYSIWNAGLIESNGKTYLKLYNNEKVKNYSVDMSSLLALEMDKETAEFIESHLAGGRNPQEVKRYLRCKDSWMKKHAQAIKPYIEKLFGVKIEA
jgi:hypothetical protein